MFSVKYLRNIPIKTNLNAFLLATDLTRQNSDILLLSPK